MGQVPINWFGLSRAYQSNARWIHIHLWVHEVDFSSGLPYDLPAGGRVLRPGSPGNNLWDQSKKNCAELTFARMSSCSILKEAIVMMASCVMLKAFRSVRRHFGNGQASTPGNPSYGQRRPVSPLQPYGRNGCLVNHVNPLSCFIRHVYNVWCVSSTFAPHLES